MLREDLIRPTAVDFLIFGPRPSDADESLDALLVIALDADGSIDAEATGSLPAEHAVSVSFVEEADPPAVGARRKYRSTRRWW